MSIKRGKDFLGDSASLEVSKITMHDEVRGVVQVSDMVDYLYSKGYDVVVADQSVREQDKKEAQERYDKLPEFAKKCHDYCES